MGISVGSVSVDIVPDATKFRPEMNAKLKDLTASVRVTLNDKAFEAEIAAATRDRVVDVRVDDKGSIDKVNKRSHALLTTLALLAPAAAPLTAVALGGAVALTGLGAAGFLAFKGIKEQMAEGTPAGIAYMSMIDSLSKDLQSLEGTAQRGVFSGVRDSVAALNGQMPALRREVGLLSKSLGSDLEPITRGILALFQDLFPATESIAGGIHSVAVGFESWATGPGGKAFAAYLAKELPIVASTLASIGTAGAHVVQALLPLGGPVLEAVKGVSDAIAGLPVDVIKDLYLAFLGYKAVTLAAAAAVGFKAAIDSIGSSATKTAGKLGILTDAEIAASKAGGAGGVGLGGLAGRGLAAIGGGSAIGGAGLLSAAAIAAALLAYQHQEEQQRGASDVKTLTSDPGALAAARARLSQLKLQQTAAQSGALGAPGVLGNNTNALQVGGSKTGQITALSGQIAAAQKAVDAATKVAGAQDHLGDSVYVATSRIKAQTAASAAWQNAIAAVSNPMQDEITANIDLHQAVADAATALKNNGKTLDLNTQKGRDNSKALLAVATAARTKITTDIDGSKSQQVVNKDWQDGRAKLIEIARKFGLSKTAATKYANALLGIKPLIQTKVVLDTTSAQAKLRALKDGFSTLQFYANQKDSGPTAPGTGGSGPHKGPGGFKGGYMWGGAFHRSSGGPVWGAGTATSDSVRAYLSNGEFVVKAATVKSVGVPFLNQLNATGAPPTTTNAGPAVVQNIYATARQSEYEIGTVAARQLRMALAR